MHRRASHYDERTLFELFGWIRQLISVCRTKRVLGSRQRSVALREVDLHSFLFVPRIQAARLHNE
eukprot:3078886-Amphidinium_carterae.1